jgi:hypothetical protein
MGLCIAITLSDVLFQSCGVETLQQEMVLQNISAASMVELWTVYGNRRSHDSRRPEALDRPIKGDGGRVCS